MSTEVVLDDGSIGVKIGSANMMGYDLTIQLLNALLLITLFFLFLIAGLRITRKIPLKLARATCLAAAASLTYCFICFGLDFLAKQRNSGDGSITSVLNQPASFLIGWMAYRGEGFIDRPLMADQIRLMECSVVLWFWAFFLASMLALSIKRKQA